MQMKVEHKIIPNFSSLLFSNYFLNHTLKTNKITDSLVSFFTIVLFTHLTHSMQNNTFTHTMVQP